jgi:hypothetical protein
MNKRIARALFGVSLCFISGFADAQQASQQMICREMLRGVPSEPVQYTLRQGILFRRHLDGGHLDGGPEIPISSETGIQLGSSPHSRYARHAVLSNGTVRRTVYEDQNLTRVAFSQLYDFSRRRIIDNHGQNSCH